LGLVYAFRREFQKAQGHFQSAVNLEPNQPRYLMSLAQSLCDQGQYERCINILQVITPHPSYNDLVELLITKAKERQQH
jgi:predicted Zn-dependent protease